MVFEKWSLNYKIALYYTRQDLISSTMVKYLQIGTKKERETQGVKKCRGKFACCQMSDGIFFVYL